MIEKFKTHAPNIAPTALVHERAYVQGMVTLSANSSIWPGASVRADIAEVVIGENSNVQDNATVHVGHGFPAVIGKNVTVGHNAIVHGATIKDNVIVGMGAVILDGAVVEENCVIGAGCLVPGGKTVARNSVAVGNPFRVIKTLTDEQAKKNTENAEEYVMLAKELKGN